MSDPEPDLAFVGTYAGGGEGVFSVRVDASGDLEVLAAAEAGEDPSFLALDPESEFLYAVDEVEDGAVTAFAVDGETGDLSRLNRAHSGDAGPAHCSVDATGGYVLVAHYHGGSVSVLPVESDGRVGDPVQVLDHEGSSVHPERQTDPHPHAAVPGPDNRFVYVPDLGTDQVVIYAFDADEGILEPAESSPVGVHDGAGPRHLDFHPDGKVAYLLNELDSTLTVFERSAATGALQELQTVRALPRDFEGESTAADVHVHPSGEWVYASNRGHDSIAVFATGDWGRRPTLVGHEPTRGETPRNFALSPAGEYLFVENKDSGEVRTFEVDDETGELEPTGSVAEVHQPSCMKFRSPK